MFLQRTIRKSVRIDGVGLHSGAPCSLIFRPAPVNTGVYFVRKDMAGHPAVAARAEHVKATALATTLGSNVFSVSTVEHCLSTLAAFRIDNLFIELDCPEIPIGDGSAQSFMQALMTAGVVEQDEPRKYAYLTHPVFYGDDKKHAYVIPYNGLRITCTIEFPHQAIGRQKIDIDVTEHTFARDLAKARTFGFLKDVELLRARGLGKGGSLANTIVLDAHGVVNPEGLRYTDEFVRHKAMDALGDLVTLGMPLMGHLILYKAGHDIMNRLVRKIIDSPECYRHIELGTDLPTEPTAQSCLLWALQVE